MLTNGRYKFRTNALVLAGLLLAGLVAGVGPGSPEAAAQPAGAGTCADFEDLMPGTSYTVGDTFASQGTPATVVPFHHPWGWPYYGTASVNWGGLAGGSGLELEVNNVAVEFGWSSPPGGLSFRFGEYGGSVNLAVNGDFYVIKDFADVNGAAIGGVLVDVTNGFGNDSGMVRLHGQVSSLLVGGQELWIDDVCAGLCERRAHFEDVPYGSWFPVGASFASGGVGVRGEPFHYGYGGWTAGGYARIGAGGLTGGSGQDVMTNNIALRFDFGGGAQGARFLFGEYGGNVNVEVNGDFANVADFAQLNGFVLGGVTLSVAGGYGNDAGFLELNGIVDTLLVGGQELWLDDVCGGPPLN